MAKYRPEQNDIDFLKQRFDDLDNEIVPSYRISPEMLVCKLEQMPPEPKAKRVFFTPGRLAAVLGGCLLVCAAIFYAGRIPAQLPMSLTGSQTPSANAKADFAAPQEREESVAEDEYAAVRDALSRAQQAEKQKADWEHPQTGGTRPSDDFGGGKGGGGGGVAESGGGNAQLRNEVHTAATVYKQDGADAANADEEYVYYSLGTSAMIAKTTEEGKLSGVAQIDVSQQDRYIVGLYRQQNTLTLVCGDYGFAVSQTDPVTGISTEEQVVGTTLLMYDVEKPAEPTLMRVFTQEGEYRSSLVLDGTIYLVSEREAFSYDTAAPVSEAVPRLLDTAKGAGAPGPVAPESILLPQTAESTGYITVSALKLFDAKASAVTRSVLGGARSVYCTEGGVYLVSDAYNEQEASSSILKLVFSDGRVEVLRASLEGQLLGLRAAQNGAAEAVTKTTQGESGAMLRALTLAPTLEVTDSTVAQSIPQARDVSFIDRIAYVSAQRGEVLTAFEYTENEAPRLLKSNTVSLPDSLITLSDSLALGIYSSDATADGAGLTLRLLSVDNGKLAELDKKILGASGSYTEALRTPTAVLYDAQSATLGLPVSLTVRTQDGQVKQGFSGYYIYRVSGSRLILAGKVENDSSKPQDAFRRGLLANGKLCLVSDSGLTSLNPNTLEKLDAFVW